MVLLSSSSTPPPGTRLLTPLFGILTKVYIFFQMFTSARILSYVVGGRLGVFEVDGEVEVDGTEGSDSRGSLVKNGDFVRRQELRLQNRQWTRGKRQCINQTLVSDSHQTSWSKAYSIFV